ncbi:MAG: hypothetical protein A2V96_01655 [Candidatus Yonathbacteria bacterium RBG_16_43_6]|uniref:Uncharacterized protein n=1 Tax=Candidatus Yonathbacteria bacterium RIFCSPLOWO2_01_FULL_43_27 TaxID=1802726 RepID=A0A1G2SCX7_9BACT|nr:MAG: hypothetical protein A2V96_01655 [Candidatus Yonathbacteria bacterium RBG_16_43_6]OHA78945.1 MAG: hypothetical protein A2658_01250 [Candidatus Yonathbacteria bacterium RIFCSPHIGHO2_01_FULL_44_19]OHA82582.1 MAG: hypothetical protein A3B07_01455 [Candidatus Yonathbacteria bacterium RIFCSPLOWO2_01_FULL_43_27]
MKEVLAKCMRCKHYFDIDPDGSCEHPKNKRVYTCVAFRRNLSLIFFFLKPFVKRCGSKAIYFEPCEGEVVMAQRRWREMKRLSRYKRELRYLEKKK